MVPRQMRETFSPVDPRLTYSIISPWSSSPVRCMKHAGMPRVTFVAASLRDAGPSRRDGPTVATRLRGHLMTRGGGFRDRSGNGSFSLAGRAVQPSASWKFCSQTRGRSPRRIRIRFAGPRRFVSSTNPVPRPRPGSSLRPSVGKSRTSPHVRQTTGTMACAGPGRKRYGLADAKGARAVAFLAGRPRRTRTLVSFRLNGFGISLDRHGPPPFLACSLPRGGVNFPVALCRQESSSPTT